MLRRFVRGSLTTEWPQVLVVLAVIGAVLEYAPLY
jgi:hypothetical protein